jgi:hypothetical protein
MFWPPKVFGVTPSTAVTEPTIKDEAARTPSNAKRDKLMIVKLEQRKGIVFSEREEKQRYTGLVSKICEHDCWRDIWMSVHGRKISRRLRVETGTGENEKVRADKPGRAQSRVRTSLFRNS